MPGPEHSLNSSLHINTYMSSVRVSLKTYKQCEFLHHLPKEIMNICPQCQKGRPNNNAWSWSSPHRAGQGVCSAHLQGAALHCVQPGWYSQGHIHCAEIWNGARVCRRATLMGEGGGWHRQVNHNEKPHKKDHQT